MNASRKSTALVMSVIALSSFPSALAAPTKPATMPTATSLLQRMQKAQGALGPATISLSLTVTQGGKPVLNLTSTSRQNDATHAAITSVAPTGTVEVYRNGDEAVFYEAAQKQFRRFSGATAEGAAQSVGPGLITRLLSSPELRNGMKQAKVAAIVLDGVPAYRITWKDATNKQDPTDLTLILGRQDSLPRKFSYAMKSGQTMAARLSYAIPAAPFAPETFIFTPAEGVTEAKAPAAQEDPGKAFVGKPASDFTLSPLAGGQPVTLSSLKGKTVLIDFWATWCGPCRASLPLTNQASKALKEKGLVVLTVNNEEDTAKVSQFMKTNGYSFTVLRDTKNEVSKLYNIQAIPTTILVNPAGDVVAYNVGFEGEEGFWKMLSDNGISKP